MEAARGLVRAGLFTIVREAICVMTVVGLPNILSKLKEGGPYLPVFDKLSRDVFKRSEELPNS